MELTPLAIAQEVIKALDAKKGADIRLIEIKDISIIAEYFVFCTGTSSTHVKTLCDELEFHMEQLGEKPIHSEGYASGSWVAMDFASVIVHVFTNETREFYQLEKLWADGKELAIEELISDN